MTGRQGTNDQSWHNPKSEWRRRVRRSSIVLGVLSGLGFLYPLSIHAIGWYIRRTTPLLPSMGRQSIDWVELILHGSAWLFTLVVGAILLRIAFKQRRLAKRIVAQDGGVCPWCRLDMSRADDDAEMLRCEKCKSARPESEVTQYWVNYWLNSKESVEWRDQHHPRRDSWFRRLTSSTRAPAQVGKVQRGWVVLMTCLVLAWAVFAYFVLPTIYHVLIFAMPMIAMFTVLKVVHSRHEARVKAGRFCVLCDYQLAPDQRELQTCPECACDWTKAGAVYSGKPRFSIGEKAAIACGMAVAFVPILLLVGPLSYSNEARWLNTSQLIERVSADRGFLTREWDELFTRELSHEERIGLAESLLERRHEHETLQRQANEWFLNQIASDTLPQRIIERFKSGVLLLSIDVPERARVGDKIPIRITNVVQYQDVQPFDLQVAIVFGGFVVEGLHAPAARTEKILRSYGFGSERYSYGSRLRETSERTDHGPVATIPATEPGILELHARYWLMLLPRHLIGTPIEWSDDGSPILPRDVEWVIEQELSATIDVPPHAAE